MTYHEFPITIIEKALEDWQAYLSIYGTGSYLAPAGLCRYFKNKHDIPFYITATMLVRSGLLQKGVAYLGQAHQIEPRIIALQKLLEMNQGNTYIETGTDEEHNG